jgi:hypothetical protein
MRSLALLLLFATASRAGVAVGRDGSVLRDAELEVVGEQLVVGEDAIPLGRFYLVEGDDGTLLWSRDLTARLRGYEFLARERIRTRAADLAARAIRARDAELACSLIEIAERNGLPARDAYKLEEKVARLKRSKGGLKPDYVELRKSASDLSNTYVRILVARARRERANGGDGLALLRAAVGADARFAGTVALLDEVATKDFVLGDGRAWLEWHLEVEARGGKLLPTDHVELKKARAYWRPDVHGIECGPILAVTGVREGKVVGRALAVGRLVDRALTSLFQQFPLQRQHPSPMRVFLYSSKEEYLTKSGTGREYRDPTRLAWTAGHYSPSEGLSRLFWEVHPDAERRMMGACVHELTHHWLRERNPCYALSQIRRRQDAPGFWIVEGFATFVEEGVFDIDARSWDLFNERCRSLDMVQALERSSPESLLDWNRIYAISQRRFLALDRERKIPYARRWSLGFGKASETRLFYDQAAATCQYLFHAENGKHRTALLRYVIDYYTGNEERLDPKVAFGMSGGELGTKTTAFAQAVARGWRPSE